MLRMCDFVKSKGDEKRIAKPEDKAYSALDDLSDKKVVQEKKKRIKEGTFEKKPTW